MKHTTLLMALSLPLLFSSCSNTPTFGDRLIAEGAGTRSLGEQWNKGNALVAEGEQQKQKGRRMVAEGEKLISKGDKNIERGKELKTRAELKAPAGTTTP